MLVATISVGLWSAYVLMAALVARASGMTTAVGPVLLGATGAIAASFLPLGGVGTFGTLETGWTLGFATAGVSRQLAVASAFAFSGLTFFCAAAATPVAWWWLQRCRACSHS